MNRTRKIKEFEKVKTIAFFIIIVSEPFSQRCARMSRIFSPGRHSLHAYALIYLSVSVCVLAYTYYAENACANRVGDLPLSLSLSRFLRSSCYVTDNEAIIVPGMHNKSATPKADFGEERRGEERRREERKGDSRLREKEGLKIYGACRVIFLATDKYPDRELNEIFKAANRRRRPTASAFSRCRCTPSGHRYAYRKTTRILLRRDAMRLDLCLWIGIFQTK